MNRKQRRETMRKIQSEDISLEVVHPNAAGIDIGNESHYVAVPPSRNSQPVWRFGCTTAELKAMADWLKQCGIRTVAMQSTGVYWIAVFDILEQAGLQVYLVNARETKNLPGRKTDVQESQWLMKLHTYGLLRNSATTILSEAGCDMSKWVTETISFPGCGCVRTIASAGTRSLGKGGCQPTTG
jgi:hypothetical protein